jgi:hypothetical protein
MLSMLLMLIETHLYAFCVHFTLIYAHLYSESFSFLWRRDYKQSWWRCRRWSRRTGWPRRTWPRGLHRCPQRIRSRRRAAGGGRGARGARGGYLTGGRGGRGGRAGRGNGSRGGARGGARGGRGGYLSAGVQAARDLRRTPVEQLTVEQRVSTRHIHLIYTKQTLTYTGAREGQSSASHTASRAGDAG